jgi:hypothetical protein
MTDPERMEKALRDIVQWARAYPFTAFPKPDLQRAHKALAGSGVSVDAISADAMRHVLDGIVNVALDGLGEKRGD